MQRTRGAELAPALETERLEKIFPKGTEEGVDSYSGFFDNGHRQSTGLGEWLKSKGVTEVFVCGLATDYCVKFTALDANEFGFRTFVIEDACRGVNADDLSNALKEMRRAGISLVKSSDLIQKRDP